MNRWQQLCAKFDALQAREKIIVAVAACVLTLIVCDALLWDAQRMGNRALDQQLAAAKQQQQTLESERLQIQQQLAVDPNTGLRQQIEGMQRRMADLDQQLQTLMVDLIPPQAMAAVLRDMLVKRKSLRLVSLSNTPSVPAFQAESALEVDSEKQSDIENTSGDTIAPTIFKHGLALRVRGNYFDVLDYLRAIAPPDGEKNQFFWERIDYQVDKYPEAEVTLRVYTLGNKEAWIGA